MSLNTPNANILNQDYYQYELFSEYLKHLNKYLYNSNKKSLPIKYYHINLNKNTNYDNDSVLTGTGLQHSFNTHNTASGKNRGNIIYDIFEFTPTLNSNSHTYQINTDDNGTSMITSGTITLYSIVEPLPGDLFHYYNESDNLEVFKVTGINFIRTIHNANTSNENKTKSTSNTLKLYEVQFESSFINYNTLTKNITESFTNIDNNNSVNPYTINYYGQNDFAAGPELFYFINEFDFYFSSSEFESYRYLIKNKESIIRELNKSYDAINCTYNFINKKELKVLKELILQTSPDMAESIYTSILNMEKEALNIFKFLSKEINSFSIKATPDIVVLKDSFGLCKALDKEEMDKIENIIQQYPVDINFNNIKLVNDLFEKYYPFIYKQIVVLQSKIW